MFPNLNNLHIYIPMGLWKFLLSKLRYKQVDSPVIFRLNPQINCIMKLISICLTSMGCIYTVTLTKKLIVKHVLILQTVELA